MKNLIAALTIFAKYKDLDYPTVCDYKALFIVGFEEGEVSPEDSSALQELGFIWSEEYGSWVSYRYGRA